MTTRTITRMPVAELRALAPFDRKTKYPPGVLISRYQSRCAACAMNISPGDEIYLRKQNGHTRPVHPECLDLLGSLPKHFYVYALTDPRTSTPRYIGKGAGSRMYEHSAHLYAHHYKSDGSKKEDWLVEVHHAGLAVEHQIIWTSLDSSPASEAEAYRIEHETILRLGLENLTNANVGCLKCAGLIPGESGRHDRPDFD